MIDCAKHAAELHAHLCIHNTHGYTQGANRWGDGTQDIVYIDGVEYNIGGGDRDCSSSIIQCWQKVLEKTKYAGCLDGATYTGNMRDVFVSSGLFTWQSMDYAAQQGDIYLNEASHTAMCQSVEPDTLSEFCISENGTIFGNSGDQTGMESIIRAYYNFPWNGILVYNHKADYEEGDDVSADDVWNFNQNGTLMRDRVQGIDSAANSANNQLVRNDDVTGDNTSGNMYDRICWIDKRVRELIDTDMAGVEQETGQHVNTGANMNKRIAYMEAEQKRQAKVIDAIAKKLEV